jgi:uncharacterized peroxidase-related enzyme
MSFVDSIDAADEGVAAVFKRFPDHGIPLTRLTEIVMRTGDCQFSAKERELIGAFTSGTNACTYCYETHKAAAEAFGVDADLLRNLLADVDSSSVDDKLKPVLRYVKKLTESPARMVQDDVDTIFAAGWDENTFHYVVMICALFNLYNRVLDGYGIENTPDCRHSRGQRLADSGYGFVAEKLK